jgi:hypothetical protein
VFTEGAGVVLVAPVVGAAGTLVEGVTLEALAVDGALALPSLPPPHAVIPTVSSTLASSASSGFISPAAPFLY